MRGSNVIVKFDGIDGCGKTTLAALVELRLRERGHSVASIAEFSSPIGYPPGSSAQAPPSATSIRELALDPAFGCDDIERQLLLHFLSRRKNRVDIPYLDEMAEFVLVDRSTLSNYAYAGAINPDLILFSDIAMSGVEQADMIFWIDTPISLCMERTSQRPLDSVERKGIEYFERVRDIFADCSRTNETVHVLDGRLEACVLADRVVSMVAL